MDLESFKALKRGDATASQKATQAQSLDGAQGEARRYAEWWMERTGGVMPVDVCGPINYGPIVVCKDAPSPTEKAVHQSIYKGYVIFHSDWTGRWWVGDPNNAGQQINPNEAVSNEMQAKRFIDGYIAAAARRHQQDFTIHPFD